MLGHTQLAQQRLGMGRSIEPKGVDFVFFPVSLVGEYCPFVSP